MFGLEDEGVALDDVEDEDGAGIGEAGEVEEIVVFAIVDGFGKRFAGEEDEVSGLELLG